MTSSTSMCAFVPQTPLSLSRKKSNSKRPNRGPKQPPTMSKITANQSKKKATTATTLPYVQTMVHAKQTGYSTVEDIQIFMETHPREKRIEKSISSSPSSSSSSSHSGSGSKRARIDRVDCYIEPEGYEVVISPSIFNTN